MFNSSGNSWFIMLPFLIGSAAMFYVGFTSGQYIYLLGATALLIVPLTIILAIEKSISSTMTNIQALKDAENQAIEDLTATGTKGTAKVLRLEETGRRINFNPQVKLLLEISVPNYPAYQANKIVALPVTVIPQVQPDSIIQVLVDPEQPDNQKRIGLMLK